MEPFRSRLRPSGRILERLHDEHVRVMVRHMPADDLTGMDVDDYRDVPEPVDVPEVDEVPGPDDVHPDRAEILQDFRYESFRPIQS